MHKKAALSVTGKRRRVTDVFSKLNGAKTLTASPRLAAPVPIHMKDR